MTTEVFFFLPPPNASGLHREGHPFGPSTSGFHSDLAIEIHPSVLSNNPALAVVSGLVRIIPDPAPATTGTLILIPSLVAIRDLSPLVGKSVVAFIYRNIDIASARPHFEPIIMALGDQPFLTSEGFASRLNRFLNGEFSIFIHAGDMMALPSTIGGTGGWALLGFEVIFKPSALIGEQGWNRLKDLIKDDNTETLRLDPISFFTAVSTSRGNAILAPVHAGHLLLTMPSRRILLEIRDEYNKPFIGTVTVTDKSNGNMTSMNFTDADRGIVEFATTPPRGTPPSKAFSVALQNRIFTELPSGSEDGANPSNSLTAPAHWALQAIFMADIDDPFNWFLANTPPLPRFTAKNKVTYLIDGLPTFREMVSSMRMVSNSDHFFRLAGWWLDDSFPMIPGDADSTFSKLTQDMAAVGAQVRALLWDQWFTQNNAEVKHINDLPGGNGQAILDSDHPSYGSHHQKMAIINGSLGAVAFCGGIDINPDRLDDNRHCATSPLHDIHAKVEGPAVADINITFIQRWNNHSSNPPLISLIPPPFKPESGKHYVQVTRTFAPSRRYRFAPSGDLGTLNAVRNAIHKAQRFIYIEDQYLTPYPGDYPFVASQDTVGILSDLLSVLSRPSFEYLIILIPNHSDQPQNRRRRHRFIRPLLDAFPNKVHVFYLSRVCRPKGPAVESSTAAADLNLVGVPVVGVASNSSGGPAHPDEIYIHTKTWIIDDIYVKIGSCNCNRRGFTHDTEIDLHVIDGALLNGARAFARNYRMDLWGEHLSMPRSSGRNRLLDDPTFALQFWLHPPVGARIRPYDEDAEHECKSRRNLFCTDVTWNTIVDPDGR